MKRLLLVIIIIIFGTECNFCTLPTSSVNNALRPLSTSISGDNPFAQTNGEQDILTLAAAIPLTPPAEGITSEDVARQKAVFAARRFLSDGPGFFREVAFFMGGLSYYSSGSPAHNWRDETIWVLGTPPFKRKTLSLRDELEQTFAQANAIAEKIDPLLKQGKEKEAAGIVENELYPLLMRTSALLGRINDLHRKATLWRFDSDMRKPVKDALAKNEKDISWHDDPSAHVRGLEKQYGVLIRSLDNLLLNSGVKADGMSLNHTALILLHDAKYRAVAVDIDFSKRAPALHVPPRVRLPDEPYTDSSDVVFIFSKISHLLQNAIQQAQGKALQGVLEGNRLFDVLASPAANFKGSREWTVFQEAEFKKKPIKVDVSKRVLSDKADITFTYDTEPEIFYRLLEQLQNIGTELGTCQKIAEALGGTIEIRVLAHANRIAIRVELPAKAGAERSEYETCAAEVDSQKQRIADFASQITPVSLPRTVIMVDGTRKTYTVELPYAFLIFDGCRAKLAHILKAADGYMRECPTLHTMDISLHGGIGRTEEDSSIAAIEVRLHDFNKSSADELFPPSYIPLGCAPFPWEDAYRTDVKLDEAAKAEEASREMALRRHLGRQHFLYFDLAFFLNPTTHDLVSAVTKRAQPLDLRIKNESESEVHTPDQFRQIIHRMLTDLIRVLDEIKERRPGTELKFQVRDYMSIRVSDIGAHDEIFSLYVYDSQDNIIAVGCFSKKTGQFIYKDFDGKKADETGKRIAARLEELRDQGKLKRGPFIRWLEQENIILPDNLVDILLEAGKVRRIYTVAYMVNDQFFRYLELPNVVIDVSDRGMVILELPQEHTPRTFYGVIVQEDGSDPEPITNFEMAKRLYTEEYPYFRPTGQFFERLRQEESSAEAVAEETTVQAAKDLAPDPRGAQLTFLSISQSA